MCVGLLVVVQSSDISCTISRNIPLLFSSLVECCNAALTELDFSHDKLIRYWLMYNSGEQIILNTGLDKALPMVVGMYNSIGS